METKYVEGSGLFRLIGENLTRSESEDVKKQIDVREHEQMRVLRTQFRDRFDDLNTKVNISLIIGGVLAWLNAGEGVD